MMRLLLTILAALGFVWAALNTANATDENAKPIIEATDTATEPMKADTSAGSAGPEASETATVAPAEPRQFGAGRTDARIVIEAKEEVWVRISDAKGALVFMRTMKPGESYRVPNRDGLVLDSGNAKGLVMLVDGKAAPAPVGMVRRGIELTPDALINGVLTRAPVPVDPAPAPAPETMAAKNDVENSAATKPEHSDATEHSVTEAKDTAAAAEVGPEMPAKKKSAGTPSSPAVEKDASSAAVEKNQDPPVPPREMLTSAMLEPAVPESPEPVAETHAEDTPAVAAATKDAAPAPAPRSGPRQFAANRHDARIVIEAKEKSWIRIKGADGKLVFMRTMKPGETYRVPDRSGLLLESGNAKGLALQVDGKSVPPLTGMTRRGIALNPEALTGGAVVQQQTPTEKPVAQPQTAAVEQPAPISEVAPPQPMPVAEKKADAVPTPVRELLTATLPGPLPPAMPASADPAPAAAKPAMSTTEAPAPQMAAVVPPVEAPASVMKPAPAAHVPTRAAAVPKVRSDAVKPTALAAAPTHVAERPDKSTAPLTAANAVTPSGVIGASTSRIGLEVQKGTLVRLSQPASTVFVADPDIADIEVKSAGLVYVLGKKAGETALFAVDDRERVILNTTLVISHNVSRLRQALRAIAPDSSVDVISVDNSLILTGTVYSPVDAENIRAVAARFAPEQGSVINQLKVLAPNQINLRVRIAEVSKETLKQFGINWETIVRTGGNILFGVATGRDFISAPGVFPRDASTNTFIASYRNSQQDINAAIDALATEGLISLLAEPNLTAMSGETASFLAGGEFPIPLLSSTNGSSGITVEFKTFGVGLAFTPHVLEAGRINLRVRPEVSQLSSAGAVTISGFSIPALTTRRAETTVELGSGQSFVIAGLLQNNTQQDLSKVPLLGDLPVLGALFRSDRFRRNESELVIIVTPYIVRPVSASRIAAPTDGFVPPSDVERILGGVTYRQQLNERGQMPHTKDGQGLIGPTGFELD